MIELSDKQLSEVNGGVFGLAAIYVFQVASIVLTFVDE